MEETRGKKNLQSRKLATRSNLANDLVLVFILGAGPLFGVAYELKVPSGGFTSTWGFLALAIVFECILLGYVLLWYRSRRSDTEIELRSEDVWLPPAGMRLRGRNVYYRDITAVERTRYRVKIRWKGGSMTYGRDALVGSLEALSKKLEKRVSRARPRGA